MKWKWKTLAGIIMLSYAAGALSCKQEKQQGTLEIVATTGMIGDAIERVAGDKVHVTTLMGPGVDPHLYKATQGDLQALRNADIIFYNGLHLEGKMQEIFDRLAETQAVFPVSAGIPREKLRITSQNATHITYDPHIWFDVQLWIACVQEIGRALIMQDPENKDHYRENMQVYIEALKLLDTEVRTSISAIPEARRVLITSHDAFGYFGRAYGMEVRGLQGISTAAEFGLKDVADMVQMIVADSIAAVFVESSVSEKSIEAVMQGCADRGHPIKKGGTLFSDAMGAKNTPEGNYIGMVQHNVRLIHNALQ